MQLSNAPGKLVLPFANTGAKNTIPAASQIGITAGAASLTDGFPPLTRTPIASGGVPPSGLDMNGILYALSAALRWANAGGGYVYDSTFAADSNVGGYPKGARVLRSDGAGYWLNTIDGNTVNPESVTVNAAQVAGWVPDLTNGIAAITMTNANVTLTPAQYGKPFIVLSGVLTANLNLIFPNLAGEWTVVNNCTGAFTVTAKTAAGTGAIVTPGRTRIIYGDGTNIAGAMNEVETPAQFDASTQLSTTAFVKTSGRTSRGITTSSISYTLTAADVGGTFYVGGATAGLTMTLPSAALTGLRNGDSVAILNTNSNPVTVAANGSDTIFKGITTATNFVLQPGDFAIFERQSSTQWFLVACVSAYGPLGAGQTAQNVIGSRTWNTTYTNTTGKPIFVNVAGSVNQLGAAVTISIGGVAFIGTSDYNTNAGQISSAFAIVPPGASYIASVTAGTVGALFSWTELR